MQPLSTRSHVYIDAGCIKNTPVPQRRMEPQRFFGDLSSPGKVRGVVIEGNRKMFYVKGCAEFGTQPIPIKMIVR